MEPQISYDIDQDPEGILVKKVKEAFADALEYKSKINTDILSLSGMSGKKYRMFINNLIGLLDDARYLEIGVWAGSTFCSAINQNKVKAIAIDNWSEYGGPKDTFFGHVEKFKNENVDFKFIESDFHQVNFDDLGPFNIYFFDGPHDVTSQHHALTSVIQSLDDKFIFIVDDWNWWQVRDGTMGGIKDAGLNIDYQITIRSSLDESHASPSHERSDWHNGYFIGVLSKS